MCACAWWWSSENATEWENEGPCIGGGVEWTVSKTMYRPSTSRKMCVYPLPQERKRKKKKSSALSTPFLPLRPLLQPPAAPSHSSYEPRAGRSEYNFLYCVNVRTIRLNKKKKCLYYETPAFGSLRISPSRRIAPRFTSPSRSFRQTWRVFRILIKWLRKRNISQRCRVKIES